MLVTKDLKCLSRLCLDPFAVDVAYILLQQRRIFELKGTSACREIINCNV
jgi:hypothetical protein